MVKQQASKASKPVPSGFIFFKLLFYSLEFKYRCVPNNMKKAAEET